MGHLQKHETPPSDPKDPWANDMLERKGVAEYLTPVIASINQPFVISLSAPYGTGKTYFLQCWQQDLQNQGFRAAYFNAWETDFSQNALFAFMAALKRQFEEGKTEKAKEKVQKGFVKLAKKGGGLIRHHALPILAKGLARKAIGDEGVKEFIEIIGASGKEIAELVGAIATENLNAQEKAEESMSAFKEYLQEVVKEFEDKKAEPEKRKS